MIEDRLDAFLDQAIERVFPAVLLHVRRRGKLAYQRAAGWLDPNTHQHPVTPETWFDFASVTKCFTVSAFLRLVADGKIGLDDPVSAILSQFSGRRPIQPYEDPLKPGKFVVIVEEEGQVDAGEITFRQLLTHTSGLPAWRPLYQSPSAEIRSQVLGSFFSYPPGARVVYSDLGLILLGWSVEALAGSTLADAIAHHVLAHMDLPHITYGPLEVQNVAPTEFCNWRGRRLRGEVHDENAWAMGGIAGHAGLFGTAAGAAALGQIWLDVLSGESQFLPRPLAIEAVTPQAVDGSVRRGLGWALWSPDPSSASHPLGQRAFGHTGFTGTSLYVDPDEELVIACLTNEVYGGRQDRGIGPFRVALHQLAKEI